MPATVSASQPGPLRHNTTVGHASSQHSMAKDKNTTAMGVAASLNMINNLLSKDGVDLNNIVGLVIDMEATVAKPTRKAA